MLNRLHKAQTQLPLLLRSLKLVWAAEPRLALAWLALLIAQGFLPALNVYLTRAFVNSVVAAIESGGAQQAIRAALLLAVLMGLLLAVAEFLRAFSTWVRTALSERVRDSIADRVHERALALDLAFFDTPEYYDNLHRATQEASYRPVALLENLGVLLQNTITLVAMMAVLLPYGLWLPLLLLASTIPSLAIVVRSAARRHDWRIQSTNDERRSYYFNWLLTAREAAAELRLFGLGPHLRKNYQDLRRRLREGQLLLVRREGTAELLAGLIALVTVGLTMLIIIWQVLQGMLTLGDLALVYQAFTQGQSLSRALLQSVGQIYSNSLFLGDLFAFLALEPTVCDPAEPESPPDPAGREDALCFDGAWFRYPHSERWALQDLHLTIPTGKIVAIVGSNGAGKSTLIKLACRFYDVNEGQVRLFGQDVRSIRLEDVHDRLSVLFQTPVYYNTTVAGNIAVSGVGDGVDPASLERAAYYAGADEVIGRLAHGYESVLGVWFGGGTDLSGGEWRRLALARTLYRQAPLIILDEPTSAMDPWAEADWVRRFRDFARGKTAVIITHRFTTAMHADTIFVMENGAIVESGSHQALLAANGRYAESWREQAAP